LFSKSDKPKLKGASLRGVSRFPNFPRFPLFRMSLSSLLASAATQAQRVLAPLCDPDGEGEFTLSSHSGETFIGVFEEQNEVDPLSSTGVDRVRALFIVATKVQFTTEPKTAPRITAVAKGVTWSVQSITPLAHHYRFTCRLV
jgi:hypothetical protein